MGILISRNDKIILCVNLRYPDNGCLDEFIYPRGTRGDQDNEFYLLGFLNERRKVFIRSGIIYFSDEVIIYFLPDKIVFLFLLVDEKKEF